jgi:asparagine synthase (glutamine-hydrolysing)
MSGIGGVQTTDGSPPPALLLSALGHALHHRGPDGERQYLSGGTGLLHRSREGGAAALPGPKKPTARFTVIDGGPAPSLETGPTLPRARLAASGAGGLALAACEPADDRIILERDAFGLRPLYYAETERGLVFASEPRAIIASGLLPARLSVEAARELVQIQFTTGRRTLFEKIQRVLPGETLIAERGRIVERFGDNALPERVESLLGEAEALGRFETLLAEALAAPLAGDGAAGLIFDTRIETLALAAGLRSLGRRGLPLIAVAARGEGAPLASCVARVMGGEAIILELDAADFFDRLPAVVADLDDPGSDYSAVALDRLAEHAAGSLRLLFSSAGGDVLFGGLGRYRSALRPLWLGGRAMRTRGFLDGLGLLTEDVPSWRDGLRAAESRLAGRRLTRLQTVQALDCAHWLPNDVLPVLDRCLGAHGLEPRTPYLDPVLAEFAFTLPDALKIAPGRGALLLRRFLATRLPEAEPFARHRGPALPVARWIAGEAPRLGPLLASSEALGGLCAPVAIRRLFARLAARPTKRLGHAAWQLLFFALWHRIHIEGKAAEGSVFDMLS